MKSFDFDKWTQFESTERVSNSLKNLLMILENTLVEEFGANIREYNSVFDLISAKGLSQNLDEQAFWNWMKKHGTAKLERILSVQSVDRCFSVFDDSADDLLEYRAFLLQSDIAGGYKANIVDSIVDTVDELYMYVCGCDVGDYCGSVKEYDNEEIKKIYSGYTVKIKNSITVERSESLLGGISFFMSN